MSLLKYHFFYIYCTVTTIWLAQRYYSAALITPDDAVRQWIYTGILVNEISRLIVQVCHPVAVSNSCYFYSETPLIPPAPPPKENPRRCLYI